MTGYTPRTWVNGGAPAISAANLQAMDDGIDDITDAVENTTTGHDHDGSDSKKVDSSSVVNTPAGNIVATDVQAAIDELDGQNTSHAANTSTHGVGSDYVAKTSKSSQIGEFASTAVVGRSGAVDYLCDGVEDDVQIQAAIDYVDGLGGGSVLVREGTYNIETPISMKDNIILSGVGTAAILKPVTNFNNNVIENNNQTGGNSNITIRNLKIDGNSTNQSSAGTGIFFASDDVTRNTNITFENLYIYDVYGTGLHPKSINNLILNDVIVDTCGITASTLYHNIYLRRCDYVTINNAISHDCVDGKGCKITLCDYVYVDAISYDNALEGIYFGGSTYFECRGIYTANSAGVRVTSEEAVEPKGWIVDVIAENNNNQGAYIQALNGIIKGIYIGNTDGVEITRSSNKCTIDAIRARDNSGYGINETGSADSTLITNCRLDNNTTGAINKIGTNTITLNNVGYNPIGNFTAPSVPATTVNYTNAYGYPCMVSIYGGTVTDIDLDDVSTGLTTGSFVIAPGETINITYSSVPTWKWWGL